MSAGSAASGGVYFFLSYAHAQQPARRDDPPDKPVRDFYRDLSAEVARVAGLPRGTPVGFADWEISTGTNWRLRLGQVLGMCGVFVPLYAPDYFESRMCGQEWAAFRRRELIHSARTKQEKAAIVPVMWRHMEAGQMPPAAGRIHYLLPPAGELYRRRAMRELVVRTNRDDLRQAYQTALTAFAERIVAVARTDPLCRVEESVLELSADEDAFDEERDPDEWRPLRFVVVAPVRGRLPDGANPELYGVSPDMWRPYWPVDDAPIAQTAAMLSQSDGFRPIVEFLDDCQDLRDGGEPSAPTVLIVDPWSTQDAELLELLRAFDAISHVKPWVRLVIPWDKNGSDDGVQVRELENGLRFALGRMRSQCRLKHWQAVAGLGSIAAFGERLPGVIAAAERGYFRTTRTNPLRDDAPSVPRLGGLPLAGGPVDGQDFRGRGLR